MPREGGRDQRRDEEIIEGERDDGWMTEGRWGYLFKQHHVLHYKGDVEQRGKTVEEVELKRKESS